MNSGTNTKVLDALKSRYPILSRPLSEAGRLDNDGRYLRPLWVFGNQEPDDDHDPKHSLLPDNALMIDLNTIDPQMIQEKLISALSALSFQNQHVLVQFWSPDAVRNRCVLTTWDQPFALGAVDDEGLYSYRLDSEQRTFVVDAEQREELGPPARVYSHKLPEWSFDIQTLPTKQSVQDMDASYNIHGYILLPVIEPDSGCCVGVFEIVTSSPNYADYAFEVQEVSRALKEENLKSPDIFEDPTINVSDEKTQHELDEIYVALKTVCDAHNLPLAQTWSLTGNSSMVANSGKLEQSCSSFKKSCIGKICMSTGDHLPFYMKDFGTFEFHKACRDQHQGKYRGVVGRSLSSCGPWFCRDVTQLAEDDYPLVPFARVIGLTRCLAIYIKSIDTAAEYVLEFFLPTSSTNEPDQQILAKTLKKHIKNVCRFQLDIKSPIQEISAGPFNCNIECRQSPATLLIASEVPRMSENIENEPSNFGVVGTRHGVVPYSEKGIPHRKRKRSESSISLEEIKKLFGKPIDEAAASLRVSRSTLKRICRNLGMQRWPNRNLHSLPSPIPFLTVEEAIPPESGNQQPLVENERKNTMKEGEFPSFHVGIEDYGISVGLEEIIDSEKMVKEIKDMIHATRSKIKRFQESHGIPRLPEEDAEPEITVKATYIENMVRFPFRLSEGLVKLEELVAMRFQLRHASFKLKYKEEGGDMIWISCDRALVESMPEFRQLDGRTVIRLFVTLNA